MPRLHALTPIVLSLYALFSLSSPTQAETDYIAINTAIARDIIVPAYNRLADAATAQEQTWTSACANPDNQTLTKLHSAYHQTADAWAGVFHWNFGPITLLVRRDRIYHWPERRNAISKALDELLSSPDIERLKLENFVHVSAAAQGLPALERLLFEYPNVLANGPSCRVGKTIAANLAKMTNDTAREWVDDVLPLIEHGESHPIYFDAGKATLNKLFTELLTGYQIINEQKILPVLGSSIGKARPNLAEARRSNRFNRNLKLNLQTLFAAETVMATHLPSDVAAFLSAERRVVMAMLDALPPIADAVYDEAGRTQYMAFTDGLNALHLKMIEAYTGHLGFVVGFNSLDGD